MTTINWGIIGCGDVTEIKSGPAFSKVPHSLLLAVMRRDAEKAADYANRHNVPRWYSHAGELINDAAVNAVYIATPPSSHEEYALAAIDAGKPVYVEKPMALSYEAALRMAAAAEKAGVKLVVAHYRREWPLFKKIKEILTQKIIGEPLKVNLVFQRLPLTKEELTVEKNAWRVNPAISGGGLFHDLAPHQLDILYWLFGQADSISGRATNRAGLYDAADTVNGNIVFENGVHFRGDWCFCDGWNKDECEVTGSNGSLRFSFFGTSHIELISAGNRTIVEFEPHQHVQQPMIERVVQYLLGQAPNPCSGWEGAEVMRWMEAMTGRNSISKESGSY